MTRPIVQSFGACLVALVSIACSAGNNGSGTGGMGVGGGSGGATSSGPGAGGAACGTVGSPCCAGDTCAAADTVCQAGVCVQQRMGETGKPCAKNSDCDSGICLPVGGGINVCTATCSTASECLPGWACGALLGQTSDVCQCTAHAESCDGQDNDCNGIVDDEPAVEADCKAQSSAFVCAAGSCSCAPANQCGGTCHDTSSDAANCGGCGHACPTGAACVNGSCTCAGSPVVCGGACVDVSTEYHLCGGACANNSDVQTCGSACTPCAGTAHGAATCDGHACALACNAGYVPCPTGCCESCITAGCTGLTYCDDPSGLCKSGCEHNPQCTSNAFCDVPNHLCIQSVDTSCPAGYALRGTCSDGRRFCTSSALPLGTTFPWQTPCPAGTTSRGSFTCGGYTNLVCVPDN